MLSVEPQRDRCRPITPFAILGRPIFLRLPTFPRSEAGGCHEPVSPAQLFERDLRGFVALIGSELVETRGFLNVVLQSATAGRVETVTEVPIERKS